MYPFFADCAVCSQGYASTLSNYGCRKCSEAVSIASSVCAVAIVGIVGLLFVRHMISIEGHRTTWISVNQIKIVLPSQSFKIIIVSWQIVTQVRILVVLEIVYVRGYCVLRTVSYRAAYPRKLFRPPPPCFRAPHF